MATRLNAAAVDSESGRVGSTLVWLLLASVVGMLSLVALPVGCTVRSFELWLCSPWLVRFIAFVGSLLVVLTMLIIIGVGVTGRRVGVLWTSRNTYSLSRLQVVMWTLLVLSALMAVAALRARGLFLDQAAGDEGDALDINIPTTLLSVMGISMLSAAATPAILSLKATSPAPTNQQMRVAEERVESDGKVQAMGRISVRTAGKPLLRDLFQSDEASAVGTVDIGKVQQALVTLVLWGVYLGMLIELFLSGKSKIHEGVSAAPNTTFLPAISDTFVYLLGISHAGYLAYKAAPLPTQSATALSATAQAPLSESLPRPKPPPLQ